MMREAIAVKVVDAESALNKIRRYITSSLLLTGVEFTLIVIPQDCSNGCGLPDSQTSVDIRDGESDA
jgi:hypothetical protein